MGTIFAECTTETNNCHDVIMYTSNINDLKYLTCYRKRTIQLHDNCENCQEKYINQIQ
jgi:hypothetical protein